MVRKSTDRPTKIKIGPFDYIIHWYDRKEEDQRGCYGYCDSNDMEIGLSERRSNKCIADTFMHEAVHALWCVLGLKNQETEENVAGRLGVGITMIARDNPEIFKWWLNLLKN